MTQRWMIAWAWSLVALGVTGLVCSGLPAMASSLAGAGPSATALPMTMLAGIDLPWWDRYMPVYIPWLTAGGWVWFQPFTWYGFSYLLGFGTGFWLLQHLRQRGLNPIGKEQMLELLLWMILFVMIFSKVGYFAFYKPQQLGNLVSYTSFSDLVETLVGGGRSFHGGLIGVVLCMLLVGYRWGVDPRWLGDVLALVSAPGLFFGRLGNFANQELWGRETSMPWGMRFFLEATEQALPRFKGYMAEQYVQIIEQASKLSGQTGGLSSGSASAPASQTSQTVGYEGIPALAELVTRPASVGPGPYADVLTLVYRSSFAPDITEAGRQQYLEQLTLLVSRQPELLPLVQRTLPEAQQTILHAFAQQVVPTLPYRHPSQLYQALGEGLLLFVVLWCLRSKLLAYKGLLAGVFVAGYGAVRFVVEFFREADRLTSTNEPYYWLGILSIGQLLCLPMIAIGLLLVWWARHSPPSAADQRRVEWAATGDEEEPPAEVYNGRTPHGTMTLAQKVANYQHRAETGKIIEADGKENGRLTRSELAALALVLPKLVALRDRWAKG